MMYFFSLFVVVVIAGCATSGITTRHPIKQQCIALADSWIETEDGRQIPVGKGDTVLSLYYESTQSRSTGSRIRYTVVYKGQQGYVTHFAASPRRTVQENIVPEYDYNITTQREVFKVHSSQDRDAWARANYYVNTNASTRLQAFNEFLLDTYNAFESHGQIFTIHRFPQGDSVLYTVKRGGDSPGECAYFIRTGKTREDSYITD